LKNFLIEKPKELDLIDELDLNDNLVYDLHLKLKKLQIY